MEILSLPIASATVSMCREASIGCRPTTARKHAPPDSSAPLNSYEALIIQNMMAHIECPSEEMHAPGKALEGPQSGNRRAHAQPVTMETTCFHYLHGVSQPERVSTDTGHSIR